MRFALLVNIRLMLRKMGNFEKAITFYSIEISQKPADVKALNNRAFCYATLN